MRDAAPPTPVADNDEISTMEARLLQMICQGGPDIPHGGTDSKLREQALTRLCSYSFRSVPHQVLFNCLWQMPRHRPDLIRDLLPARLVQAGFPDFDLAPFFEPHGLTAAEAKDLLDRLAESGSVEAKARQRGL